MSQADATTRFPETGRNKLPHLGLAWTSLCAALAVHVADEALTDFLSVYNPTAQAIRQQYPFLPLPVFTFATWLTGLILAIIALFSLSPFAFRYASWMRVFSYPFGVLMFVNGVQHIAGSFYLGRLMPGVYSSPLLIICSMYLLWAANHDKQSN